MFVEERKVIQFNTSLMVNLPNYMAIHLGIIKGDKVKVEMKGDEIIIKKEKKTDV